MSSYFEMIITPNEFYNCDVCHVNIELKKAYEILLTGTVYDEYGCLLEGAVVELFASCQNYDRKIGYVVTNENGEFAIVVNQNNFIHYKFYIYEPLVDETIQP